MEKQLGRNTIVLLGIGHTNAHVLRMWKMNPIEDAELVCVSNHPIATYSGMMPGVLAGQYNVPDMQIDLVRLCASAGVRLIIDEVVGIDHENRDLIFKNRPPLAFEYISVGIGSRPTFSGVQIETAAPIVPIKAMQTFLDRLRQRLSDVGHKPIEPTQPEKSQPEPPQPVPRIVVVGGGIGSIEIACCLDQRLKSDPTSLGLSAGQKFELSLITASEQIGSGLNESTREKVESVLAGRGIGSHTGQRVTAVADGHLRMSDGEQIDSDVVIWATGAVGPELLSKLELELDDRGFVKTRSTLQSISQEYIFAVGDSGTLIDHQLPKAGVYAVRQGPVLWDNLRRSIWKRKLIQYVPQNKFLKLINTADGKSIAEKGKRSFYSSWCWYLKNHIDKKFMRMYQDYSLVEMAPQKPSAQEAADAMRCLGCGGKIGSQLLSSVLEELEVPPHPDVIIGLDVPDDAAVVRTLDNQVTVTTDFFASPMNDPYLVGRLAMLNSTSDCFVMGAQPTATLAIIQLPLGHPRAQRQVMREVMAGAVEELKKMGATIVGGHSIEGPRLTAGFTVLGHQLTDPKTKGMLQVGDQLVLTKPLGSGVLLAALMQGKLPGNVYLPMIESMLKSNQISLELIKQFDIQAVTDVTGFGLAGHLSEMLRASKLSAEIAMDQIPMLDGCQELIEAGIQSTLAPDNRLVAGKVQIDVPDIESNRVASLFDPQTSGGLLFGVRPEEAQRVLSFLADNDFGRSAIVGEVIENKGNMPTLKIR